MTELITVKGATYNSRVALSERNPAHPGGEAYIIDGMVAQVALTPEVQMRLGSGLLVQVNNDPDTPQEPETEPIQGYDSLGTNTIVEHMASMGEIERIILRQYEASHKNRDAVLNQTFEPEPFEGYDALNVTDVLERKATLTAEEWDRVREYEASHKNRRGVIESL